MYISETMFNNTKVKIKQMQITKPMSNSIIYRIFEKIRQYFGAQSESIPMSFVLGFYVSLVVKRWWEQYKLLPWPDTLALFISAAIPGNVSFFFTFFLFQWQCCNLIRNL